MKYQKTTFAEKRKINKKMNYIPKIKSIIAQAGAMLMHHQRTGFQVKTKNKTSLVTNVDILIEDFLKKELSQIIPDAGFVAEESEHTEQKEFMWVIDPIDGTRNFVRGIPYFCINVALQQNDQTLCAITYNPWTQEWFWAEKDQGFWHNGIQKRISSMQEQSDATYMIVVSDFLIRQSDLLNQIKEQCKQSDQQVKFRVNGSVALDLALTAAGSFDLVIFQNLAPWDRLAGIFMIQEAGGAVLERTGRGIFKGQQLLVAGKSEICQQAEKIISSLSS